MRSTRRLPKWPALPVVLFAGAALAAPVPGPERLLPQDTLLVLSTPEAPKLVALARETGPLKLWADPAMKPFTERLAARWREEFLQPLERELNLSVGDFSRLAMGQVTIAVVPNGKPGASGGEPGWLFLLDARDKEEQLKASLAGLRKRLEDAGRQIRTEKLRDYEFLMVQVSSNDLPKTVRRFLPRQLEYHELGEEPDAKPEGTQNELAIGQAASLLVVASGREIAEQTVARLAGAALPVLAEQAVFAFDQQSLFREAPVYGWANSKVVLEGIAKRAAAKKENPQAPSPVETIRVDKFLSACGLLGLKGVGFSIKDASPGLLFELRMAAPESLRTGLVRLMAGEPKETAFPAFVPAEMARCQRWRMDGQKAWGTLEKMLAEISPQSANVINFVFDTANMAAREKDPGFDIRKNLIGNLGDDFIVYEKAPQGEVGQSPAAGPRLILLSSPKAEELAAAMKSVLVFVTAQAGAPVERDFLGRKVYSVTLPSGPVMLPGATAPVSMPRTLHYAASGGYVAFSTDVPILEEFLRSADTQIKALRNLPDLTKTAEKVVVPGTSMFAYENQAAVTRLRYEALRQGPGRSTNAVQLIPVVPGMAGAERRLEDLADFTLLPTFEKVAGYFQFSVASLSANVDGISYKVFFPAPRAGTAEASNP